MEDFVEVAEAVEPDFQGGLGHVEPAFAEERGCAVNAIALQVLHPGEIKRIAEEYFEPGLADTIYALLLDCSNCLQSGVAGPAVPEAGSAAALQNQAILKSKIHV